MNRVTESFWLNFQVERHRKKESREERDGKTTPFVGNSAVINELFSHQRKVPRAGLLNSESLVYGTDMSVVSSMHLIWATRQNGVTSLAGTAINLLAESINDLVWMFVVDGGGGGGVGGGRAGPE